MIAEIDIPLHSFLVRSPSSHKRKKRNTYGSESSGDAKKALGVDEDNDDDDISLPPSPNPQFLTASWRLIWPLLGGLWNNTLIIQQTSLLTRIL